MNYGFYREYRYCQCPTVSLCIKEWPRLADRRRKGKPHGVYRIPNVYLSLLHDNRGARWPAPMQRTVEFGMSTWSTWSAVCSRFPRAASLKQSGGASPPATLAKSAKARQPGGGGGLWRRGGAPSSSLSHQSRCYVFGREEGGTRHPREATASEGLGHGTELGVQLEDCASRVRGKQQYGATGIRFEH